MLSATTFPEKRLSLRPISFNLIEDSGICINTLVRFITDQCDNHAVEVEEEQDQVEAELDERFL